MDARRTAAVILNPIKVDDDFRSLAGDRLERAGYDVTWLETTEDDPGAAMTRQAVDAEVDLVVCAGGDGTVRVVAAGLANTGIPMGLVPAGTGNLLVRNLGLPLKLEASLDVICSGGSRSIDTIELTVDDGEAQRFVVMAGTGLDAVIMDETDPKLKSVLGPGAYFLAATKAAGRLPVKVAVKVDGNRRHHRRSMICLIGNVGKLTGGIELIPQASPDDGSLDVYVASPHSVRQWVKALVRLVTRRPKKDDHVDVWVGRRVEMRLEKADTYQIDGDVEGTGQHFVAEVDPGSLLVCVPAGA